MIVKEIKGMKGLFSEEHFEAGEVVCHVIGEKIEKPSRTSVQVGINQHIDVKAPVMYINHDCKGNITLKNDTFVAKRAIAPGEEITFDYNESEDELAEPFICKCCGREIRGRKFLEELVN